MKKKKNNWVDIHGRNYLRDVLPLDCPYSILVEPIRACNFKCVYCKHSSKNKSTMPYAKLSIETFKKFAGDFEGFNRKLKQLAFIGLGEPLLHGNIAEMVKIAKNISDRVVIITNGSLLTKETSLELIKSGIDCIRISLQGLCAQDYKKMSQVDMDYDEFLTNIKFLYENKKHCEVSVKIPDVCLDTEEKVKLLYQQYENITDFIVKQTIVPVYKNVSYDELNLSDNKTMHNDNLNTNIKVCPQPFYVMQLMADGMVRPCCSSENDVRDIGNVNDESIVDIWRGEKLYNYRKIHLEHKKNCLKECATCTLPQYTNNDYDNIDSCSKDLVKKYELCRRT